MEKKSVYIGQFVREVIDFARRHSKLRPCTIHISEESSQSLIINPFLFEQMMINLLLNAADASKPHGRIEVFVKNQLDEVWIEVHDNGSGIREENREELFNVYYTTKPDGAGLGLTTVKACADLHGASIQILKSHLGGALFRVAFPLPAKVEKSEAGLKVPM